MGQVAPFSAVSVNLDVVEDMTAALRRIAHGREISVAEALQLHGLEIVRGELREVLPRALSGFWIVGGTASLRDAMARAGAALAIPMAELLDMRAAVPRRPRWQPLALGFESLTWLGMTRITDDLRLICQVGIASPERQRQLALARDLQADLSALVEFDATNRRFQRAKARIETGFAEAAKVIGDQLPAIRAEAAAIRARRQ